MTGAASEAALATQSNGLRAGARSRAHRAHSDQLARETRRSQSPARSRAIVSVCRDRAGSCLHPTDSQRHPRPKTLVEPSEYLVQSVAARRGECRYDPIEKRTLTLTMVRPLGGGANSMPLKTVPMHSRRLSPLSAVRTCCSSGVPPRAAIFRSAPNVPP